MILSPRTSFIIALLALSACAKKSGDREPTMSPESADEAPASDIDALEAQLTAREGQLRALGAGPSEMAPTGAAATRDFEDGADGDVATHKAAEAEVAPSMSGGAAADERASRAAPSARCENICDLSTSICQLQDQICALAPRHPDEPRYLRACDRATVDCGFATEACHACS